MRMNETDRKNVIEYYNSRVWHEDLPKSDTLEDGHLELLKDSLGFARWMLKYRFNDVVKSIKELLVKLK